MRRWALLAMLAWPALAHAQSSPGWATGYVPTAAQWNTQFGNKVDTTNGASTGQTLTNPTLTTPTVNSGTISGAVMTAGNAAQSFTAGMFQFNAQDGSPQFYAGKIAGSAEYFDAMGGLVGNGPVLLATNGATGNVDGNFAAQESGGLFFGNGSGTLFGIVDPGAAATDWLQVTPAVSGGRSKIAPAGGQGWNLDQANLVSSLVTQGGFTVAEFGGIGVASGGAWMRFTAQPSFGTMQCVGATNTGCFIQASGTGTVLLANSSGTLLNAALSSANTDVANISFRAASTTQPILMQPSNTTNNVAAGGNNGSMTALATTATAGYFGIPVVAGTPTGVPVTSGAGVAWIIYDSTNNKVCVYVSGWKCTAALS